jgi:acetate kinase
VNIFVVNPGSSSLKFGLYCPAVTTGEIEDVRANDMKRATQEALSRCHGRVIDAVGCRVVHGGSIFSSPAIVDDSVLGHIRDLSALAPLHNPLAVDVIEEVRRSLPSVPIVAVFDTAFHHTLPAIAWRYATPEDIAIRRYGFHGISYAWVSSRLTAILGPGKRVIICHLGNGASTCAVADGRSVDTSMGLTPMEGLVMGTRSGDIDPGAILHLLRSGMSEGDLEELLNRRSGLLGVSGKSGDMRQVQDAAAAGDDRAALALDLFAYRVAKYIGSYAAAMSGVDAMAFTAGIGEHSVPVRERVCSRLRFLGIEIDDAKNREPRTDERCISSGSVPVFVIPTNEELQIARDTDVALSSRA